MYEFKTTGVYWANKQATEEILINQGGTDSSKTYSILQLIIDICTNEIPPYSDPVITIVGSSVPNLKKGAYRVFKEIINSYDGLSSYIVDANSTDRTFTFKSGWIVEFTSYQTEQEAKQGKRQYLFVNEANGIKNYRIFWQLCKRTRRQTWIDYNPTAPFWAHDNLIGTTPTSNDLGKSVRLIRSDHRANPFLTPEQHWQTENIQDKELWRVYARGLTGNISGIILTNCKMIPDADFPDIDFIGGIDYGYTNDPTACAKVAVQGNSVFVHELCYEAGLPPKTICQILKANGFTNQPLYSEHDPDMIGQIRRIYPRIVMARKGVGSVNAGLMALKQVNIFYTESSKNFDMERKKYEWEVDKQTGKLTNTPIDGFDHLISALRYAYYTHYCRHLQR